METKKEYNRKQSRQPPAADSLAVSRQPLPNTSSAASLQQRTPNKQTTKNGCGAAMQAPFTHSAKYRKNPVTDAGPRPSLNDDRYLVGPEDRS